jgi:hypothetical protein
MKSKKRTQRLIACVKHHEWQALSRKGRRAFTQMCVCSAKAFSQPSTNNSQHVTAIH